MDSTCKVESIYLGTSNFGNAGGFAYLHMKSAHY